MKVTALALLSLFFLVGCNYNSSNNSHTSKVDQGEKKLSGATLKMASWEQTPRVRILKWIDEATKEGSPNFIPVADRIAVVDNDGTLWPEQPVPNQVQFAVAYLKSQWENHPEWEKDSVLKGLNEGNFGPLKNSGMAGIMQMINASHTGMTETEFSTAVRSWADTAKNPRFDQLYVDIIYQPMLELLDVLRENEFKTFIVSGGGADFMRVWSEEKYGIPPYQIIGSYGEVKYEVLDGTPVIHKTKGTVYVDDKAGKPQAIHRFIGKRPVFCGGNSDGDQAMMQYTSASDYKTLSLIVHHTDAEREYAYDTKTLSGHLETALVEAKEKDWLVVDMKNDWIKVFPFEQ